MIYVDTSAAFKLLSREPGVDAVERLFSSGGPLISSSLLRVELHATAQRRGVSATVVDAIASHIGLDSLDEDVAMEAIALRSGLRTLDALHLATASLHRESVTHIATFDRELATAAERIGIPAWDWATG